MVEWWTAEDTERYNVRKQVIIDQFSKIEVLDGKVGQFYVSTVIFFPLMVNLCGEVVFVVIRRGRGRYLTNRPMKRAEQGKI